MNLHNVRFVRSAARPADFLRDGLPQVVFAGRSNVGKSSVINCLLARRNFARVGDTPGKTAHVNYFLLDARCYLVDLPGYGFARVSQAEKQRWAQLMEAYFAAADALALGVLVVDSRHAPTGDDQTMAQWFRDSGRPWLVLANKLDKLRKSEVAERLACIRQTLALEQAPLIAFSAQKGEGREALLHEVLRAAGETA